jgi:hypothetical protein
MGIISQNLRRETSRTFGTRKGNILKTKLMRLKLIIKTKKNIIDSYRGINEVKEGYQLRFNVINDENGNPLADPQNVLIGGKFFLTRF